MEENISRREKKELLKAQKGEKSEVKASPKWLIPLVILVLLIGGAYWIYKGFTKPLPGEMVADMGADHVTDISGVSYNSNPPTSGSHFAVWAKRGVYDRIISDGHLLHSLEHGYVVISYNCSLPFTLSKSLVPSAYAHETEEPHEEPTSSPSASGAPLTRMKVLPQGTMSWFTPENPPEIEVELPQEFSNQNCKDLVTKLSGLLNNFQRLVIVPRVFLEVPIALTAWGRIEKLENYDEARIRNFISTYHNKGPEKTVE